MDVHLTRNRPPPARRRRSGPTQRTSFRRAGQSGTQIKCTLQKTSTFNNKCERKCVLFSFSPNVVFVDLPSPSPLPQLYQQHTAVGDWPEQVEVHPFSAEEESELGYMDYPYQEETFEDLLTPSFLSLETDTLQIMEVM